ncbi:hypothetical protein TNCV_2282741 [Trichonephila clavipes]|nr:hypothetical protein TNCV_2282741 [Trichonephila clavipes]
MSSFLVLSEGDTLGTGGVMDKCIQMLDKELWRLEQDGPGEKDTGERGDGRRRERRRQKRRKGVGERERSPPCMEKRAESGDWSGKTMNAGGVENRID